MSSVSFTPNSSMAAVAADLAYPQSRRSHTGDKSQEVDREDDRHSRRMPGANEAQRQLNQRVLASLNGALARDGLSVPSVEEYNDYAPEKVASRILSFVEAGIAQADGDEAKLERLEQARAGIQQGLDEAREILDGLSVLQGDIKDNVDRTENLLKDGLDRIQDRLQSGEEPAVAMLKQVSRSMERSASVQIETQDGDIVTIDISRSNSMTRTMMAAEDENSQIRAMSIERSRSSSFSYSVQGELDEGEQAAINDLLKDLDKVSRKFFNGNIDQAFNKAARLNYDQDELASFTYSAEQTVTRQKVSAYVSNSNAEPQQVESVPGTIKNYLGEIASLIDEDMPKIPMKQPIEAIERLFTEIMQARVAEDSDDDDNKSGIELLQELVGKMVAKYEQPEEEQAPDALIAPDTETEKAI